MTIFQKMLLAPLISLMLFSGLLVYSYLQNQKTNHDIGRIRDDYLPLLEIANDNIRLFGELTTIYKDAVVAGERDWIQNGQSIKQQLAVNLSKLGAARDIVDGGQLSDLRRHYHQYHNNAQVLAVAMLEEAPSPALDETLVQNVERYHNLSTRGFIDLKSAIQNDFESRVDIISNRVKNLLVLGLVASTTMMAVVVALMLRVSLSTRRNLRSLIDGMRELAKGHTDFSRRLDASSKDELGTLIHWFNRLSEKMERDYKTVENLSFTDKLTQLNNRSRTDTFLGDTLAGVAKTGEPLSVVLLDIDHFKGVNDDFGHLVGDRVLQGVAEILKQSVDASDFIGRWGGEEFVLVLPGKDKHRAAMQAEQVRATIQETKLPDVGEVTASFGVAEAAFGDDVDAVIKRADDCLYEAKRRGRNCVISG